MPEEDEAHHADQDVVPAERPRRAGADARSTSLALAFARRYRIPMVFTWYVGSEDRPVYQAIESFGG